MQRILRHEPVDRIGLYEHFWNDTYQAWQQQGHIAPGESYEDHFGFDMQEHWSFNLTADLDFERQVVAETADTITYLDGNGATLRRHKFHDTTPEHVDFQIKTRADWERIKPLLTPDPRRIDFEGYRRQRQAAAQAGRFFVWSGINVFECIHPVTGHEHMLIGMVDDPDWVLDMAQTYAWLTIELQKQLLRPRDIRTASGIMKTWDTKAALLCRRACTGRSSCPLTWKRLHMPKPMICRLSCTPAAMWSRFCPI